MLSDNTTLSFPANGQGSVAVALQPQVLRCRAAGPGGRPLTVLIDTGTDPSAIDLGLARRLGLRLGDFALGHAAASDCVPYTETVLPWLNMGGLVVRDLFALALDLSQMPFAVDLVLGYNVLRQLVLHIDYQRSQLLLRHPDLGAPALAGALAVPLAFYEHFPSLTNVRIDSNLMLPLATIDTGSNAGLSVGPDLAAQLGLRAGVSGVDQKLAQDFGGACEVVRRPGAQLQIGPFTLAGIDLDTQLGQAGDLGRLGRANLGNGALSRFASLSLDYGRAEAWICA